MSEVLRVKLTNEEEGTMRLLRLVAGTSNYVGSDILNKEEPTDHDYTAALKSLKDKGVITSRHPRMYLNKYVRLVR